jgi:hypothetical protein
LIAPGEAAAGRGTRGYRTEKTGSLKGANKAASLKTIGPFQGPCSAFYPGFRFAPPGATRIIPLRGMNKYNFRAIRRLARQIRERQSLMNSHQQSWRIILDLIQPADS